MCDNNPATAEEEFFLARQKYKSIKKEAIRKTNERWGSVNTENVRYTVQENYIVLNILLEEKNQ